MPGKDSLYIETGTWLLLLWIALFSAIQIPRVRSWQCIDHNDVIISAMASQITNLAIVYSIVDISTKTPKLCATGLCEGNSQVTGKFPAKMASNAENASIWWHHHVIMGIPALVREICIVTSHKYPSPILLPAIKINWFDQVYIDHKCDVSHSPNGGNMRFMKYSWYKNRKSGSQRKIWVYRICRLQNIT